MITDFYETQANLTSISNYPKKLKPKHNRTIFQDELIGYNIVKDCHGTYFFLKIYKF